MPREAWTLVYARSDCRIAKRLRRILNRRSHNSQTVQSLSSSGGEVPSENFSPGFRFYSTASPIRCECLGLFLCAHNDLARISIERINLLVNLEKCRAQQANRMRFQVPGDSYPSFLCRLTHCWWCVSRYATA